MTAPRRLGAARTRALATRLFGKRAPAAAQADAAAPGPQDAPADAGGLGRLLRRYYPVGVGAACLAMFVAFFPSTIPSQLAQTPLLPSLGPAFSAGGPPPGLSEAVPAFAEPLLSSSAGPGAPAAPADQPPEQVAVGDGLSGGGSTPPRTSSPPQCPLDIPPTGTPLDAVLAEVTSVCATLGAELAGAGLPQASAATTWPQAWMSLAGTAGSEGEVPGLSTAEAPSGALVLGLFQAVAVPGGLNGELALLEQHGVPVVLLLRPSPDTTPADFARWATTTVETLRSVSAVGLVLDLPASSSTAAFGLSAVTKVAPAVSRAEAAAAALAQAVPGTAVGLWWPDASPAPAAAATWLDLAGSVARLRPPAFVGAGFVGAGACDAVSSMHSLLVAATALSAAPLVVEGAKGSSSAGPACMVSGPAQAGPWLALWQS